MGVPQVDADTSPPETPAGFDILHLVSELSGDVVTLVSSERKVLYAGDALWRTLERAPGEAKLDDLLDVVHPDDIAIVHAQLERAAASRGQTIAAAFRVCTSDGECHYVEARAVDHTADPSVGGTVIAIRDVTEKVHLENALRTLRAGNQVLLLSTNEAELLSNMCATMVEVGGYRLAWVGYAQDDDERSVVPVASSGDVDYIAGLRISWADNEFGRGPTGVAIRTNTIQVARDLRELASFVPWRERALSHGFRTSCVLPLSQDGRVIGAVSIYSSEVGAFEGQAIGLLEELADDLTYGIARVRDAMRITKAFESTVAALTTVSELRDPYTAGHQNRVGMLAAAVARRMRVDEPSIPWIRIAGELHDLGKIIVPAEILSKPGRLTESEMGIIRGHPQAAFDIVESIGFPGNVADMILQHHERLDGSGYPQGLRGEDILIGSRILAVADTVEAMANHRPYRPSVGLESALDEIRSQAGTLFDPDVVSACLELFERDHFVFGESPQSTQGIWVQPLVRESPPLRTGEVA